MLDQARQSLGQLPPARLALLGGVVVGVVALLLGVARWATAPDYALLFGNLSAADAGAVVEQIETEGIAYELRDGGTAVYVPRDDVHALRLRLASQGVVSDGVAGYELFDAGTLGMTDFMQRLNVKRALEGELSRTIASIRQVESARVHLVLPERSPFRDQQQAASASVVLAVRGALGPDQVAGVAGLVAGAVEGMAPADVTVLDEAGRMLTGPGAAEAGLTSGQLRLRQEVEEHLAEAGQSMLDQMLGPGRAVVRVAADLDLSRTQTETRAVDPEAQALVSEERQEEVGAGAGATSSVRNFDYTRETRVSEQEAGTVRKLTVSVLLDEAAPPVGAAADEAADEEAAPTPFTDTQLGQIESLVKNAVGFDEARGDRFAVQQIRFNPEVAAGGGMLAGGWTDWVPVIVRYLLVGVALLLAYRLLKSLVARLDELPAPAPEAAPVLAQPETSGDGAAGPLPAPRAVIENVDGDPYADKLSPEARERLGDEDLLAGVAAHVQEQPAVAAELVRDWLRDDAVAA
ncbi:MAG: flagellar basal-body MS-ring/collar protein FliF [Bacteroidota bacterium]